jgi:hypothetical protein
VRPSSSKFPPRIDVSVLLVWRRRSIRRHLLALRRLLADYSILVRSGFTKRQAMQSQYLTAVGAFVRIAHFLAWRLLIQFVPLIILTVVSPRSGESHAVIRGST